MRFDWRPEKNAWLRKHRGISFDEVIVHLGRGDVWKTSPHPNQKRYPRQSIAFVIVNDYVHMVPFEIVGEVIHLRTIIPSRKATRQYLSEQERRR